MRGEGNQAVDRILARLGACLLVALGVLTGGCPQPPVVPEGPPTGGDTATVSGGEANVPTVVAGEGPIIQADSLHPPTLSVQPDQLDFGASRTTESLFITNLGDGDLPYEVRSDAPWLRMPQATGVASGRSEQVQIVADRAGLVPGRYVATVVVSAGSQVAQVRVLVDVSDGGSASPGGSSGGADPGAPPLLEVDQTLVDFGWYQTRAALLVRNAGGGNLDLSVSSDVPWAGPMDPTLRIDGDLGIIDLVADRDGLSPGTYAGTLRIENVDGQRQSVSLRITVYRSVLDWGFDPVDATQFLQSAIDSGASPLVVPNVGAPWIVRPLRLRSDLELYFEPGVVLLAHPDDYYDADASLLVGRDVDNIVLHGYGAALRMRKQDYLDATRYPPSQTRHVLALLRCSNVRVEGLTFQDAGGDGIYIGGWQSPSRQIEIRNCVSEGNLRQGLTITNGQAIQVTGCTFRANAGQQPESGVDLEPNFEWDVLSNIVFRDCLAADNAGAGFVVSLWNLGASSAPVSVRFENCRAVNSGLIGLLVDLGSKQNAGTVEFVSCSSEGSDSYGLAVLSDTTLMADVRFEDCVVKQASRIPGRRPILFELPRVAIPGGPGQVVLTRCLLEDDRAQAPLLLRTTTGAGPVVNATGLLEVLNPAGWGDWARPVELNALTVRLLSN